MRIGAGSTHEPYDLIGPAMPIGHDHELAELDHLVERTRTRSDTGVLVEGMPEVGKNTLVSSLTERWTG